MAPNTRTNVASSSNDPRDPMTIMAHAIAALAENQNRMMEESQQRRDEELRRRDEEAQRREEELRQRAEVPQHRVGGITEFRRLNPSFFHGTESALEAEQWLSLSTELLVAARVPEADRVNVLRVQLLDVARSWLLAEEVRHPVFTWELFRGLFLEKFFPDTAKMDMKRAFVTLRQGTRSVDEYAAEFTRLSRFAPRLVETEEERARQFEDGLSLDIQRQVVALGHTTYAQSLDAARKIERLTKRIKDVQQRAGLSGGKRLCQQVSQQGERRRLDGGVQKHVRVSTLPSDIICEHCKKAGHEKRNCWRALGLCLICGESGHKMAVCPRRQEGRMRPLPAQLPHDPRPAPQRQGRAFLLTSEEPVVTEDVAGMTLILVEVPISYLVITSIFLFLCDFPAYLYCLVYLVDVCFC